MTKPCHTNAKKQTLLSSFYATVHCLSGCLIGEVLGLILSMIFGLSVLMTFALSTTLAYISGFLLATIPLMRREHLSFQRALKIVWLGELISIAIMEISMNLVDYWMGGMQATSLLAPVFWYSMVVAAIAGFLAAWPVNHLLLKKELKSCH